MRKEYTYNTEKLLELAQNYLAAEDYYRQFIREHTEPVFPGARSTWLNLDKGDTRIWYHVYEKESSCTWDALRTACEMVNADPVTVLATAKAINRQEKRLRWQKCVYLPDAWNRDNSYTPGDERLRRFWSAAE